MPGDPWATAQANVGLKYDPQQAAIERAIEQNKAGTIANEQALQGYGNTGRGIIGETFGTLYGLLGQNRAQQNADLGQQVGLTNQGYDEAIENIRGYGNTSANYLDQMARNMGQEGAGLRANTELADIVNTSLGRGSAARATYGGNLSDWAKRMDVLSGQNIDAAHQSESLRKSEFETQLLKLLGSNKLEGQLQENEWTGKLSDILGARQNDLIAMYQELAQQEWENAFKQATLDQQAAEAAAARAQAYEIAAMQESGANSRAASAKDDSLDWAKFEYGKGQDAIANAMADKELGLKYKDKPAGMTQADWVNAISGNPNYLNNPRQLAMDAEALARGDFSYFNPPAAPAKKSGGGINFKGLAGGGLEFGKMLGSPAASLYSRFR